MIANIKLSTMDQQTTISIFERRAKSAGLPMAEICRRAGVHPTTFSRWKQSLRNPAPIAATTRSLEAIDRALVAAENPAEKIALGSQTEGRGGGSGNSIGTADAAAAPDVSPPPPSTGEAEAGGVLPCAPGGGV